MSKFRSDNDDDSIWAPKVPVVPDTWEQVDFPIAFASISTNSKKIPAKSYLQEGKLPVVDQGQPFIGGYTNDLSMAIDPGDDGVIVFGDHTRVFKRLTFPFAPGADGIKVLRPLLSDSKYARYACLSLQFPNRGYSRHYSYLTKCKFPVAPELEQERIVSKIDELFSEIEEGERALESVQKLVERYRQSVFKAAVTGELTREWREKHKGKLESGEPRLARILKGRREAWEKSELEKMKATGRKPANEWKERYPEPSDPKFGLESETPEGWLQLSLEQGTRAERPIAYGVLQPGEDQLEGIPLVRVCDIAEGHVDLSNLKKITPEIAAMFPRTRLKGGEVLLTLVGTIGRTAVAPPDLADGNVARAVGVLVPVEGIVSEWLEICLRHEKTRQVLTEIAREVARKTLNLEQLREYAIPVPSRIEQTEAVSRVNELFSKAAEAEHSVNQQLKGAAALRQSILKAAFSGLLVDQETTDEPASVLLEHIAAERSPPKGKISPKITRRKKVTA